MRFHASRCVSFQMPVHPGVMRPSALTFVISVITRPAPPSARLPRCATWKSFGTPSTAEYMHIGETTTRLGSVRPRSVSGVNIGGVTVSSAFTPAFASNQRSARSTSCGSRSARFACVMRRLRVMRLTVICRGSRRWWRLACSNHSRLCCAAVWMRPAIGLRSASYAASAAATSFGCLPTAAARPMASSIASLVPEPIEKCAVCAESPTSATFSWNQRSHLSVANCTQSERFERSEWPASSSAKSVSQYARLVASSA
jgi:hypothetical protein